METILRKLIRMSSLCWNCLRRGFFQYAYQSSARCISKKHQSRLCVLIRNFKLLYAEEKHPLKYSYTTKLFSTDASTLVKTGMGDNGTEPSISIEDDGRKLYVNMNHGKSLKFHSVWLRFNCHCPVCKQEHSGQKLVDVADVNTDTVVTAAQIVNNGKTLKLLWSDHTGEIPFQFLQQNSYSDKERRRERFSWISNKNLPIMTYSEMVKSKSGVLQWLRDINDSGLCLLTNVPIEDKMVAKVAEEIAPVQNTIYGTVFEVKSVPNPINVAYSSAKLDFHMDLVYYESPPGIQFLHCVQFDKCVEGGESLFLDVFHVAELFRDHYPDEFRTLTRIPATFQKIHYKRDNPVHMKYQRPHIVLNNNDEIVGVNWAPAFEGPLSVPSDDVIPYYKAYHKFAEAIEYSPEIIEMKLEPGDLVSFNNRRILHGRKEIKLNGGVRNLQGCYVNIDEFKSRINVLSTLTGNQKPVKNVGNQCWTMVSM